MNTRPEELYHYTACGLDWVYLANGYKIEETPYGPAVSIEDLDGLHGAIMREIITSPHPIRGQELRFIRSMLDVSQDGMGKILGVTRVQVARYEADREKPISRPTGRALRMFCVLKLWNDDLAERVVELVNELDRLEHETRATFRETERGWTRAAA